MGNHKIIEKKTTFTTYLDTYILLDSPQIIVPVLNFISITGCVWLIE